MHTCDLNDSTQITATPLSTGKEYYNVSHGHKNEYIEDSKKDIRLRWFNPRKIHIKNKFIRNIKIQIRNCLPYRIRID